MRRERTRKLAFRTIPQIGIRYAGSPLSRMLTSFPEGSPVAGDRFPWLHLRFSSGGPVEDLFRKLDDTRFNLMLFAQPSPDSCLPEQASRLMVAHAIPDDPVSDQALAAARIVKPSFYLLRPDGHIGLAGTELDITASTSYLNERMKLGKASISGSRWNEMAPNFRR